MSGMESVVTSKCESHLALFQKHPASNFVEDYKHSLQVSGWLTFAAQEDAHAWSNLHRDSESMFEASMSANI